MSPNVNLTNYEDPEVIFVAECRMHDSSKLRGGVSRTNLPKHNVCSTSPNSADTRIENNKRGAEDSTFVQDDHDVEATDTFCEQEDNQEVEKTEKGVAAKKVSPCKLCSCFLLGLGLLALSFLVVVFVGAEMEEMTYKVANNTEEYYRTPDVCAIDSSKKRKSEGTFSLWSFSNSSLARSNGCDVAHCGQCGQCSTPVDIEIMALTKKTLTDDTKNCGMQSFFGGREAVEQCMEEKIGFTPDCNDCWVDNVMCTKQHCKFTCIRTLYILRENNNKDKPDELNSCLKCDEVMCGPKFIECSGANRRRLGITSDIGRSAEKEQCKQVDIDWERAYDENFYPS